MQSMDTPAEVSPDPHVRMLAVLDALILALDRRVEVAEVISGADDVEVAQLAIQQLLDVSEESSIEVLNMRWRCWTRAKRQDLVHRRDRVRAESGLG